MKKIKKLLVIIGFMFFEIVECYSQTASVVHDPVNNIPIVSTWLTSIDELYTNYDMVMNSITQIENQYKAIQQAIENAKGIDWENIQFDGDFDIRDDIRDATKRVNSLLSQANAIKDTLNTTIISTDGGSYSLADICGFGSDDKNFGECVKDVYSHMKMNVLSAAAIAVNGLSEEQERAIWTKYGISPTNYYLVAQTSKLIRDKASECVASATDQAKQLHANEKISKLNTIIEAAMKTKTSDGTIPEGAIGEASLMAADLMVNSMMDLRTAVNNSAAAISQKLLADEQQKEIEASEKQMKEKSDAILNANVPGTFAAGRVKVERK